ncbi:MAG: NAD(+) diphosphatase [Bacteroidales bacterium]|nr:NAD(+) diphosphatase [Bacteroidales bacterium]
MALLDHITSWEGKRTYIFRGREILTDKGGDAADAGAVASLDNCILQCCEDTAWQSVGILLQADTAAPAGYEFTPVPAYFFAHDDAENARAARMKSLAQWLADNRYCPFCGQPLQLHATEAALACPSCGRLHFPRVEPCIITLISRGDEILLLRNIKDRAGIYACLAGFVEVGETLEQALRREVREETALEVENIRYAGSQGWPFPDQLMVGFYADYKSGELCIQESEIADARWFRRDSLPPLPKPGSIAWRLINGRFAQ